MYNVVWVALTELVMTAFIIWIIGFLRKNSSDLSLRRLSISLLLLVMMGSMFDSLIYYLTAPRTFFSVVLTVTAGMFAMAVAIVYIFWIAMKPLDQSMSTRKAVGFSALLGWNEVSMAVFLRELAYPHMSGFASAASYLSYFGLSVTSFLFLAPMLAEMIFFVGLILPPGMERRFSLSLLLMQVADPALLGKSFLVIPLLAAYAIIMVGVIYYVFSYLYRTRKEVDRGRSRIAGWFVFIIALSTAGLLEPVVILSPFGLSWLVFAISMIASMILYFEIVLGMFSARDRRSPAALGVPQSS